MDCGNSEVVVFVHYHLPKGHVTCNANSVFPFELGYSWFSFNPGFSIKKVASKYLTL